jgi:uncharacterized membrane protein YkgB
MIDPQLNIHLEKIENELSHMRKRTTGVWHTLWRGCIYGAGYVIGAVVIIVVVGWILNLVGIIPSFSHGATEFRTALGNIGGAVK